jgi:hypothetical protein
MTEPPDRESRPYWVYYRDRNGQPQKFDFNVEIRLHGYWRSRADDDPPAEVMYRIGWRVYLLHGVLDSKPVEVTPREAKAWFEARQAFTRGTPDASRYATPADLLSLEDPPDSGPAGPRVVPGAPPGDIDYEAIYAYLVGVSRLGAAIFAFMKKRRVATEEDILAGPYKGKTRKWETIVTAIKRLNRALASSMMDPEIKDDARRFRFRCSDRDRTITKKVVPRR